MVESLGSSCAGEQGPAVGWVTIRFVLVVTDFATTRTALAWSGGLLSIGHHN
jgi:hypothetical protein